MHNSSCNYPASLSLSLYLSYIGTRIGSKVIFLFAIQNCSYSRRVFSRKLICWPLFCIGSTSGRLEFSALHLEAGSSRLRSLGASEIAFSRFSPSSGT